VPSGSTFDRVRHFAADGIWSHSQCLLEDAKFVRAGSAQFPCRVSQTRIFPAQYNGQLCREILLGAVDVTDVRHPDADRDLSRPESAFGRSIRAGASEPSASWMDVAKRTRSGKWILFIGFHPRCWTAVTMCSFVRQSNALRAQMKLPANEQRNDQNEYDRSYSHGLFAPIASTTRPLTRPVLRRSKISLIESSGMRLYGLL